MCLSIREVEKQVIPIRFAFRHAGLCLALSLLGVESRALSQTGSQPTDDIVASIKANSDKLESATIVCQRTESIQKTGKQVKPGLTLANQIMFWGTITKKGQYSFTRASWGNENPTWNGNTLEKIPRAIQIIKCDGGDVMWYRSGPQQALLGAAEGNRDVELNTAVGQISVLKIWTAWVSNIVNVDKLEMESAGSEYEEPIVTLHAINSANRIEIRCVVLPGKSYAVKRVEYWSIPNKVLLRKIEGANFKQLDNGVWRPMKLTSQVYASNFVDGTWSQSDAQNSPVLSSEIVLNILDVKLAPESPSIFEPKPPSEAEQTFKLRADGTKVLLASQGFGTDGINDIMKQVRATSQPTVESDRGADKSPQNKVESAEVPTAQHSTGATVLFVVGIIVTFAFCGAAVVKLMKVHQTKGN